MIELNIIEKEELDSTNRALIDMAKEGAPIGTTLWAHKQSAGRGRLGREFSSPEGGIYVSFLVPSPIDTELGLGLTAMSAVAVKRTIKTICNKDCAIKWVNDIIYDGKKVCGILTQGAGDKAVIGIGINYRTKSEKLPDDLRDIASSLYKDGEAIPQERLFVEELAANVYALCSYTVDLSAVEEYKCSSTVVGKPVRILRSGEVVGSGMATYIDDEFHLHVVDDNGIETVLSTGEVSVRIDG